MRTQQRITLSLAVAALSIGALAGCSLFSPETAAEPSASATATSPSADYTSDLVGAGCADYAATVPEGAGSIVGMAQDPVAVAAANNPLLTTLVSAVSGQLNPAVNLVDALNSAEYTIFAPVDTAFAALPAETLAALAEPANAAMLQGILSYHAISGQILPSDIVGEHTTVEGATLTVAGSGDDLTVGDATVICGGVHTANATVYLIDTVLMPPAA